MNITSSLLKYLICLFNVLFLLCGTLLIVWGVVTLKETGTIRDFNGTVQTATLPVLAVALGSAVFLVAFFGCCGALTENRCCTATYSVLMLIITCLQIALVVWLFVNGDQFVDAMGDIVKHVNGKNDADNGFPMDPIEINFQCCGLNNHMDYSPNKVPKSCCGFLRQSKDKCTEEIYSKRPGCHAVFVEFWRINTNLVRWVGIFVALIEVVVLWFACSLASKIRNSR